MELNWKNAEAWETLANDGKEKYSDPVWEWDCNFKLNFDGPLLRISSRFYPPHKNEGDYWEGSVQICLLKNKILTKEFKCNTLDELKAEVEKFTKEYTDNLLSKLTN